ncbi:MAG: hypothetical protein AAGP08_13200 [Pseudomonadota bacterium]
MREISTRERHNSYGVLFTVLGLLIAIVFASDNYDEWDALVSLLGLVFAVSYMLRVRDADVFERGLVSFTAGLSAVTCLSAGLSFATSGESAAAAWVDQRLLPLALGLAVAVFGASTVLNKMRKKGA